MAEQNKKCGSRALLPCKCNGVTVLEAGQDMSSGLGLLLLVNNDKCLHDLSCA